MQYDKKAYGLYDLLKDLKKSEVVSEIVYKSLKPRGSMFGIPYGLCNKQLVDNRPPFRPLCQQSKHLYI